jgi:hypothetical protein
LLTFGRDIEMKRLLVICLLVFCAAVWADRTPAQNPNNRARSSSASGDIPFVTKVTPREAPSGAVIQLHIQSNVSDPTSLLKYRLAIGGVTAQFQLIYKNDKDIINAVVPYNIKTEKKPEPGASIPVEILFFDPQEHGGVVYD